MQQYTILIVDNEKPVANALKRALWKEDYRIITACGGQEALSKIETFDCNLIIANQKMPSMGGTELLYLIEKKHPEIVKILITDQIEPETDKNGINRDFIYGFISKPWNPEELKTLIRKGLEEYKNSIAKGID